MSDVHISFESDDLAFPSERFIDPVPSDFQCFSCGHVSEVPKECVSCGILLCRDCEQNSKKMMCKMMRNLCPNCRSMQTYRDPSKLLLKFIGKLKIQCIHHGCTHVTCLSHIRNHQRNCHFKTHKCRSSICSRRGSGKFFVCDWICEKIVHMENAIRSGVHEIPIQLFKEAIQKGDSCI